MTEQVKIGVIGTSWWANDIYLPSLSSHKRAALLAICGRNRERADEMAAKYAIPQVYTDYRDMIEHTGLDAVVVSTPDDTHYDMVMAALDAGLHVICEKPVALNAGDAKAMLDKAEAAGVKHMVYFTFRWVPNYRYLKQLVDAGYVGQVYQGLIRYMAGYARSSQYGWRFDGERANGILGDLGSHMIDLARWYIGEIESVSAIITNCYERQHADGSPVKTSNDAVTLSLSFVNGAHASIQVSAAAYLAERNMHQETSLYGADGTLELIFYNTETQQNLLRGVRSHEQHFSDLPVPDHLLMGKTVGDASFQSAGARYFVDCILDDRMPEPNLYDGYKAQQVIDAALESHQTGQRVTIP